MVKALAKANATDGNVIDALAFAVVDAFECFGICDDVDVVSVHTTIAEFAMDLVLYECGCSNIPAGDCVTERNSTPLANVVVTHRRRRCRWHL